MWYVSLCACVLFPHGELSKCEAQISKILWVPIIIFMLSTRDAW